jgi:hypothetical protein
MIYVDGKEYFLNEKEVKQFGASHTWTVATHRIMFDYANGRIQCADLYVPARYRAFFSLNGAPKQMHQVIYSTGKTFHPSNSQVQLDTPMTIPILGGYREVSKDHELNWFMYFAPWLQEGVAYDKNAEKFTFLYNKKKIAHKAETEAEILWKMLDKAMKMKPTEIVSKAKAILKESKVTNKYFTLNEELLNTAEKDSDEYLQEISMLKVGIIKFVQAHSLHAQAIFAGQETRIFDVIEAAKDAGLIEFSRETPDQGMQGKWITTGEKSEVICQAKTDETSLNALYNAVAGTKGALMLDKIQKLTESKKQTA